MKQAWLVAAGIPTHAPARRASRTMSRGASSSVGGLVPNSLAAAHTALDNGPPRYQQLTSSKKEGRLILFRLRRCRIENQSDLSIRRTGLAITIEKKFAEHAAHRRAIDTKLNWLQCLESCHNLVVDLRYVHPSFSIVDNDHCIVVRYVWCESFAQSATGHDVAWENHDGAVRRTRARSNRFSRRHSYLFGTRGPLAHPRPAELEDRLKPARPTTSDDTQFPYRLSGLQILINNLTFSTWIRIRQVY